MVRIAAGQTATSDRQPLHPAVEPRFPPPHLRFDLSLVKDAQRQLVLPERPHAMLDEIQGRANGIGSGRRDSHVAIATTAAAAANAAIATLRRNNWSAIS